MIDFCAGCSYLPIQGMQSWSWTGRRCRVVHVSRDRRGKGVLPWSTKSTNSLPSARLCKPGLRILDTWPLQDLGPLIRSADVHRRDEEAMASTKRRIRSCGFVDYRCAHDHVCRLFASNITGWTRHCVPARGMFNVYPSTLEAAQTDVAFFGGHNGAMYQFT